MYRGRTFNRERVYMCGDYLDGDIYPVIFSNGDISPQNTFKTGINAP